MRAQGFRDLRCGAEQRFERPRVPLHSFQPQPAIKPTYQILKLILDLHASEVASRQLTHPRPKSLLQPVLPHLVPERENVLEGMSITRDW